MTDYELGFRSGEHDAWNGRGRPLPKRPECIGEQMRGYWDARLPRNMYWPRERRIMPALWDVQRSRYVAEQEAA